MLTCIIGTIKGMRLTRYTIFYWFSFICFYWYILTGFWGPDGHAIAFTVLVIYFLYWSKSNWRLLKSSSIFWIATILSGYVILRTSIGYFQAPETLNLQLNYGHALLGSAGFSAIFLIPWLIGPQREYRYDRVFIVILLSFSIQLFLEFFIHPDGVSLSQIPYDQPTFQMGHNSFGFICGILLVGTVSLSFRYFHNYCVNKSMYKIFIYISLLLLIISVLCFCLLITQSRSSWLATMIALLLVVVLSSIKNLKSKDNTTKIWALSMLGIIILIPSIVASSHWGLISERISQETHVIYKVFTKDIYELKTGSISARFMMWKASYESITENMHFGISPGKILSMINSRTALHFKHPHNTYLEVFVSLGAIGFILYASLILISIREIWRATKLHTLSHEWSITCAGILLVILIEGLFDFLMHNLEPLFMYTFVFSLIMAIQITNNEKETNMRHTSAYNTRQISEA